MLEKLIDIAKVQSTEASNKIEGIVTTSTRVQQICADKTTLRNRDEEEIMGYRDVLNTIHESYEYIPIRSSYILQLHRDLYKYSERGIGGRFKITQNLVAATYPDGTQKVLFTPLAPYETPAAIDAICESLNRTLCGRSSCKKTTITEKARFRIRKEPGFHFCFIRSRWRPWGRDAVR